MGFRLESLPYSESCLESPGVLSGLIGCKHQLNVLCPDALEKSKNVRHICGHSVNLSAVSGQSSFIVNLYAPRSPWVLPCFHQVGHPCCRLAYRKTGILNGQ